MKKYSEDVENLSLSVLQRIGKRNVLNMTKIGKFIFDYEYFKSEEKLDYFDMIALTTRISFDEEFSIMNFKSTRETCLVFKNTQENVERVKYLVELLNLTMVYLSNILMIYYNSTNPSRDKIEIYDIYKNIPFIKEHLVTIVEFIHRPIYRIS